MKNPCGSLKMIVMVVKERRRLDSAKANMFIESMSTELESTQYRQIVWKTDNHSDHSEIVYQTGWATAHVGKPVLMLIKEHQVFDARPEQP
jgi:hypothetical protein